MGANASTAVPLYASGQVLDAARLNLTNAGVPVFAGTATRDAAFGGSGEKVLAEGQLCYLEDANVVQYFDGVSFATVGPTTVTAPALTFISETTFTAATSFSLPASTFTATYDNYFLQMFINVVLPGNNFSMRLRAAGVDVSSGSYTQAFNGQTGAASATTHADNGATSARISFFRDSSATPNAINLYLFSPQKAVTKGFTYNNTCSTSAFSGNGYNVGGGVVSVSTQCDSATFISSAATNITGTCRVYGIANS